MKDDIMIEKESEIKAKVPETEPEKTLEKEPEKTPVKEPEVIDKKPTVATKKKTVKSVVKDVTPVKKTVYEQKVKEIDASLGQRPKLSDVSSGFVSKEDWDAIFSNTDDADKVINKWKDVTDFLEGMSEDTSLGELLMDKASKNDISTFMTEQEVADYIA